MQFRIDGQSKERRIRQLEQQQYARTSSKLKRMFAASPSPVTGGGDVGALPAMLGSGAQYLPEDLSLVSDTAASGGVIERIKQCMESCGQVDAADLARLQVVITPNNWICFSSPIRGWSLAFAPFFFFNRLQISVDDGDDGDLQ
jgi:hypothetical protein